MADNTRDGAHGTIEGTPTRDTGGNVPLTPATGQKAQGNTLTSATGAPPTSTLSTRPGVVAEDPFISQPGIGEADVQYQTGAYQPAVVQTAVTQPAVTQPPIYQPTIPQPGVQHQPGTHQPGLAQPGVTQPGVGQAGVQDQAGAHQPGLAQPPSAMSGANQYRNRAAVPRMGQAPENPMFLFRGPPITSLGPPVAIPRALSGTSEVPAGEWDEYLSGVPYTVARQHDMLKSRALATLVSLPSQREPVLRNTRQWTAKKFDENIGKRRINVEATLVQIKGVVPLADCQHCAEGRGPFAQCIVIAAQPGQENELVSCGNCMWAGHGKRCSFYRSVHGERTEDTPPGSPPSD